MSVIRIIILFFREGAIQNMSFRHLTTKLLCYFFVCFIFVLFFFYPMAFAFDAQVFDANSILIRLWKPIPLQEMNGSLTIITSITI